MKDASGSTDEIYCLRGKDPSVSDDLWPEFTLSNVDIFDPQNNNEPTSLFEADTDRPLTLVGRLDKISRELHPLILRKVTLPLTIRIRNVEYFAFGQREDGGGAIWAAGNAGWFLIRPSRTYKDVYRSMAGAIAVLYFATDFYSARKGKKSLEQHAVREIFREFSQDPAHDCPDMESAERTFLAHRRFLLGNMQKPPQKHDIRWKRTPLYSFLAHYDSDEDNDGEDEDEQMGGMDGAGDSRASGTSAVLAAQGKSSLRPRTGTYSIKAASRRRSFSEVDDDDSTEQQNKRKRVSHRILRSSKQIPSVDEMEDDAMNESLQDDETGPDALNHSASLPVRDKRRAHNGLDNQYKMELVEERIPSYEPNSPGDVWRCPFDGCSHTVYAASTERAKSFIRDHYQNHAYQNQVQIDLIHKEERPYLPVSNLIKRIRDIAAAQPMILPNTGSNQSNGRPTPIRQRY